MKIIKKIFQILISPKRWILGLARRRFFYWMPDEMFLKMIFRLRLGYKLNLKNPQTFNEKLQWLKLYDRRPEYTTMVDKYEVKKYVAAKIGKEYIIPTLGVWDRAEDIDFDSLPNQFVLKTTHGGGGGGIVICKDKAQLNRFAVIKKLKKSLLQDIYKTSREWPYKNVSKCVFAEKYMEDTATHELRDYKIHCFHGVPKVILVCQDRYADTGLTEDFYSEKWEHLNVKRPKHPNAQVKIMAPKELGVLLELSRKLSKDIPFLRTDFYIINHRVYFGELTFYPAGGFEKFIPESFDNQVGCWLKLPQKDNSK